MKRQKKEGDMADTANVDPTVSISFYQFLSR